MSSKEFTEHLAYDSFVIDPIEKIEVYLQKICFYLDRGPVTYEGLPRNEEDYRLKFTKGPVNDSKEEGNSIMGVLTHWKAVTNARFDKKGKGKFK